MGAAFSLHVPTRLAEHTPRWKRTGWCQEAAGESITPARENADGSPEVDGTPPETLPSSVDKEDAVVETPAGFSGASSSFTKAPCSSMDLDTLLSEVAEQGAVPISKILAQGRWRSTLGTTFEHDPWSETTFVSVEDTHSETTCGSVEAEPSARLAARESIGKAIAMVYANAEFTSGARSEKPESMAGMTHASTEVAHGGSLAARVTMETTIRSPPAYSGEIKTHNAAEPQSAAPAIARDVIDMIDLMSNKANRSGSSMIAVPHDRPRCLRVWLAVFGLALLATLMQACVPRPVCEEYKGETHQADTDVLLATSPWIVAILVGTHIDHRGRYDPESRVQRWARIYLYVALVLLAALRLDAVLRLFCVDSDIAFMVLSVAMVSYSVLVAILSFLSCLRLHVLQQHTAATVGNCLICGVVAMSAFSTFATWSDLEEIASPLWFTSVVLIALTAWLITSSMFSAVRVGKLAAVSGDFDAADRNRALSAVSWVRATAWATAATGATTLFSTLVYAIWYRCRPSFVTWGCAFSLDLAANTANVIMFSGLVGPRIELERQLDLVGAKIVAQRERLIKLRLADACSKRGTSAATIQSLVDGCDPALIFEQAKARFRRIDWDTLRRLRHHFDSSPLDSVSTEIYKYSEPAKMSDCDVFLSHSWHDDSELKWTALTNWCEEFKQKRGRWPTLWVDKFCVNQRDVATDLQCLPVFLAACNGLLVIAGSSYTTRLWCVMELYVHITMQKDEDHLRSSIELITLGIIQEDRDAVELAFCADFNAEACTCYNPADKDKIMAVIKNSPGGVPAFNAKVKSLVGNVMSRQDSIPSANSSFVQHISSRWRWPNRLSLS